jgi:hypothetical protein
MYTMICIEIIGQYGYIVCVIIGTSFWSNRDGDLYWKDRNIIFSLTIRMSIW